MYRRDFLKYSLTIPFLPRFDLKPITKTLIIAEDRKRGLTRKLLNYMARNSDKSIAFSTPSLVLTNNVMKMLDHKHKRNIQCISPNLDSFRGLTVHTLVIDNFESYPNESFRLITSYVRFEKLIIGGHACFSYNHIHHYEKVFHKTPGCEVIYI